MIRPTVISSSGESSAARKLPSATRGSAGRWTAGGTYRYSFHASNKAYVPIATSEGVINGT
jgi:hypothetical protein